MAMWGASLEDLNKLSTALGTSAATLQNDVHNALRPQIENCPWSGPDSERFRQDWAGTLAPALLKAVRALEDAASHVLKQMQEQEQASSAEGAGTSSGASAGPALQNAAGANVLQPAAGGLQNAAGGLQGGNNGSGTISLGAGGAPGSISVGTPAGSGAPAAPAGSGQVAAAGAFVSQWQGKVIDADGSYGAQCFDVFRQYNRDVVGAPDSVASGQYSNKAADIYLQYESNEAANYYDRIPKGSGDPQPGDIVVFGTGMGQGYGHVGLVAEAGGGKVGVLEQNYLVYQGKNWNNPTDPAKVNPYDMGNPNILGYLRPKQVK